MMQEKDLFEYAVIRLVPLVEREEFLNVGVVLFCRQQKFLKAIFEINEERIRAFAPNINMEQVGEYLLAFRQICAGHTSAGPISQLPIAERFRWLAAPRSTILQTSRVHSGFCEAADDTLDKLFEQLVCTRDSAKSSDGMSH